MPDDQTGEKIAAQPVQNITSPQPVNAQPPPDSPHTQNAEAISEQSMTSEIHGLEDRIRGAEKWMIWLTGGIVFLTAGIVIVGILQWNAMRGQLREMHSGGTDTHDLAVAAKTTAEMTKRTMAAVNAAHCGPVINNRDRLPYMYFVVACDPGKIDGTLLRGGFEITVRNLKTGTVIGEKQSFVLDRDRQLIRPGGTSPQLTFDVANFSERNFYSLLQGIVVSGSIEYDDGFDRTVPVKFCQTILPFRSSDGRYNGMTLPNCGPATEDVLRKYREEDKKAN